MQGTGRDTVTPHSANIFIAPHETARLGDNLKIAAQACGPKDIKLVLINGVITLWTADVIPQPEEKEGTGQGVKEKST